MAAAAGRESVTQAVPNGEAVSSPVVTANEAHHPSAFHNKSVSFAAKDVEIAPSAAPNGQLDQTASSTAAQTPPHHRHDSAPEPTSILHGHGATHNVTNTTTAGHHDVSNSTKTDHSSTKDNYVLTRSVAATARLNLSHYIWHSSFGYNLHPRIADSIRTSSSLRVADVGTGSGIWLLDLANSLQATLAKPDTDVQLDGLDISLAQCPPHAWLPSNVTLRLFDVFDSSPLPKDMVGVYDVVHVRHFVCIVQGNDPTPLLQKLVQMLKPGGWLQWDEWDVLNRHLTKALPETPHEQIDELERAFEAMMRHTPRPSWPSRLDDHFLTAGMHDVCMEKRLSPLSLLPCMHDLSLLVFQELIDHAEASGNCDGESHVRRLRELLAGAVRESRNGVAWNLPRCMAVGRKGG